MSLPDDYRMPPEDLVRVRLKAEEFLRKSGALGVFPTPLEAIVKYANVEVVDENIFDEGFFAKFRHKAEGFIKKALSKVQGLLDLGARLVYIDKGLVKVKQTFLTIHEIAHTFLPWQCKTYKIIEECEKTLSSEHSDAFDKEANAFTSEVLFQNDSFTKDAAEEDFGILVPVRLAQKKYKSSSIYSAIRRYAFCSDKVCAVVVLEMPELVVGKGMVCKLRRSVHSPSFDHVFGTIAWPEEIDSKHEMGACIPYGKMKMSGKKQMYLRDRNGDNHLCIFETFNQTKNVFVLIHSAGTVNKTTIIMPNAAAIMEYAK